MPIISSCPGRQVLEQLMVGKLPVREAEELANHLEKCSHCLDMVQTLPVDDTLVEAMQTAPDSLPEPDNPEVEGLIERLQGLRSPGKDSSKEGTSAGVSPGQAGPSEDATAETLLSPPVPGNPDAEEDWGTILAPPQGPDEIGRLGSYRVLKVLGSGGMGVVFQAEDAKLKRPVALKVMKPAMAASATARQRFLREAQTTAAIEHDHIVAIYQVDEDRRIPFLAMPLLRGETLEDRLLRVGKFPLAEVLRIGREIAEGLAAAHEHKLIHRDIKPSNIWLEGKRGRVKILDFGLARAVEDDAHLTQSGAIAGTPHFMAPEQACGQPVDHRCDLFSLGCVLYCMSTGEKPFKGSSTMQVLLSLGGDQPKTPRELHPALPAAFSDLVMRLLAKNPAQRPSSAAEVITIIRALELEHSPTQRLESGPTGKPGPLSHAQSAPARRRNRLAVAVSLLLAISVGILAGAIIYVKTDKGTIKIETNDDRIKVIVEQGGKQIQVIDTKTGKEIRLDSGVYKLRIGAGRRDIVLAPDRIQLKRGETVVVTITPVSPPLGAFEKWVKAVAALPAEQQLKSVAKKLQDLNPGFDGKLTPTIEDDELTVLILVTDSVTDISPLRALAGLRRLECPGSAPRKGKLTDLSPLKGLRLKVVWCYWTKVADLSPLKGMPLEELNCNGTKVVDLSPLRGMPLKHFSCGDCALTDLSSLGGMRLTKLEVGGKLSDLSPLKGMPLEEFWCQTTNVSDLTPLQGMPLRTLSCWGAKVTNLAPLKGLPLQKLWCDFKPKRDTALLRSIKTLELINGKPAAEFWKQTGKPPPKKP